MRKVGAARRGFVGSLAALALAFGTAIVAAAPVSATTNANSIRTYVPDMMAWNVVVTPDGAKAYVYGLVDDEPCLIVIDAATDTVIGTIEFDDWAQDMDISPDGSKLYVPYTSAGLGAGVAVIDVATDTVTTTIPVPSPSELGFSPDGSRAFVVVNVPEASSEIWTIDVATDSVTGSPVVLGFYAGLGGLAFAPDGSKAYLAGSSVAGAASVLDPTTGAVIGTIPGGQASGWWDGGLAFSPDGSRAYAIQVQVSVGWTPSVAVIDTATNSISGTIALPGALGGAAVAFAPDGTKAYVVSEGDDHGGPGNPLPPRVFTIDTASNSVIATAVFDVRGGSTTGVAFVPNGTKAYAAGGGRLAVIQDAPSIALGAMSVVAGANLQVTGSNLSSSTQHIVKLQPGNVTLGTPTTDGSGAFSGSYTVPISTAAGAYTVTVATAAVPGTVIDSEALTVTLSSFTAAPTPSFTGSGPAEVPGTVSVGDTLTATPGTWAPVPTTLTYQWLRNGTTAIGTNSATYDVVEADRGQLISVRVTAASAGYLTTAKTSGAARVATQTHFFVAQAYRDFLGREPTPQEVAAGAGLSRHDLLAQMSTSNEWISTSVTGFYNDTLGRSPDAGGLNYWASLARGGYPIVSIAAFFYASDEYFNGFGGGDYETWVADLYQKLMNRTADAGGLAYWVSLLEGGASRQFVASFFYQSDEKLGRRVDALYQSILGRSPDPAGRLYWAQVIKAEGDISLSRLLAESTEYFNSAQTPH